MIRAGSQTLNAKAWEWVDEAPWSKKTVSVSTQITDWSSDPNNLTPTKSGVLSGIEVFDSDSYISPKNLRVTLTGSSQNHFSSGSPLQFCLYLDPSSMASVHKFETDWTECIINCPIPDNTVTSYGNIYYYIYARRGGGSNLGPQVKLCTLTVTYDVYYKDHSQGGQELPSDWVQNTTGAAPETVTGIPTVTTAADPSDTLDGIVEDVNGLQDSFSMLFQLFRNIWSLSWIPTIVLLSILCGLLCWFLH